MSRGKTSLPNVERRAWAARISEWRDRKVLLRRFFADALAEGDKRAVTLVQEALAAHNQRMPDRKVEVHRAFTSYHRRLAAYMAQEPVDAAQEARFAELDRLMRQRYGVNVSDPS